MITMGIDAITFYVPRYTLDLSLLARASGVRDDTFQKNLAQEQMAFPPPCEDAVTMGLNAALRLKEQGSDLSQVQAVLFATESGVDHSKAAGVFMHPFLGLPPTCRSLEIKQACYAGTGAIRLAMGLVLMNPEAPVLVIMSDIARYERGTPGEATQGAGAVALLISSNPKILEIEPGNGTYTKDIDDFWRPTYLTHAVVAPQYSIKKYMEVMSICWENFTASTGLTHNDLQHFCYHTPFTRMAEKIHQRFRQWYEKGYAPTTAHQEMSPALIYNRKIGNAYTSSLYLSLISLLENTPHDLSHRRIGLFSYGSGCVAEYFSATVQPGYRDYLNTSYHHNLLTTRIPMRLKDYEDFYAFELASTGETTIPCAYETGPAYLKAHTGHQRQYALRTCRS